MTSEQDHPASPGERGMVGSRPQLPPVPPPSGQPVYRRLGTAALLTLLFAVGIWLGRLVDFSEPAVARVAPTTPLTTTVTVPARAPSSCVSALDRGDAAIHLLVGGVRDQRLTDQLKTYLEAAKACRKALPSR